MANLHDVLKLLLAAAVAVSSVTGVDGQQLSVNTTKIKPNQAVVVTGKNFDTTVGIYLAFCKVPKYAELPTPCGGGIDKTGASRSSIWISSNPPVYGKTLAKKFGPKGSFKYTLRLSPKIGDVDCRKVQCAITVRADHTRGTDRNHDLFIPITFTK